MSQKVGELKETPIIEIDELTDFRAVIENCPLCGEKHEHSKPKNTQKNILHHKVSHCQSLENYYLIVTDQTKTGGEL